MEGNCTSENPPPSAEICCADELCRSSSDASSLTAENCEDLLDCSPNVKPDDSRMWTDEKHSLYLEHLEVSFIKQLHQSIGLLAQCSNQNKRDERITQIRAVNDPNSSKQVEEKIDYKRGDPLSHVSADSPSPIKSHRVNRLKRIEMHCPPASTPIPELLTLRGTENHGKVMTSHGFDTCSQQFSARGQYHGDSHDLITEGTGQNFVDEDDQTKSNTESRVKRLKTELAD